LRFPVCNSRGQLYNEDGEFEKIDMHVARVAGFQSKSSPKIGIVVDTCPEPEIAAEGPHVLKWNP
jgi:hypothetical protein